MIDRGNVVLDASALLAMLHSEEGSALVANLLLDDAAMSMVNLAEVASKEADLGADVDEIIELVQLTGVQLHDFDLESAAFAARLRGRTKARGLSLGDRACLALGMKLKCPVVTADRVWSELDLGVEVIQIR